ncbi:MAG: M28 family peptidase [Desulfobacteraceae bacterium]|nr:M28 family peptidase [Desulfobacteraceae bacterium]
MGKRVKFMNLLFAVFIVSMFLGVGMMQAATNLQGVTVTGTDATGKSVKLSFSSPLDPASVRDSFVLRVIIPGIGYGTVAGNLVYEDGGLEAAFIPVSDLVADMDYTVTMAGAKDLNGNPLDFDKWSFTGPGPDLIITLNALMGHLEAIEDIADANEGHRTAGTSGYTASVEYIKDVLDGTGLVITEQPVEFRYFKETKTPVLEQTSPNQASYSGDFLTMTNSGSGDITAEIAFVSPLVPLSGEADPNTSTDACESEDFEDTDLNGKIVLIQRGTCDYMDKAENAEVRGAAAVLIFNEGQEERTGVVDGDIGDESEVTIPVLGISYDLAEALYEQARADTVTLSVSVAATDEVRVATNLIAETPGGNPDQVVMIGGILDSPPDSRGINPGGSGLAALLELAYQVGEHNYNPVNKLRFAWWSVTAGSSDHYTFSLDEDELSQIAMYLDVPTIASPNYILGVQDGDLSVSIEHPLFDYEPGVIPAGSDEIETAFADYFSSMDIVPRQVVPSVSGEYYAFIYTGIPFGGLFTGLSAMKTEEEAQLYGGTAGEPYDSCIFASCDNVENISQDALMINAKAVAHVAQVYAEKETLFEGPKKRRAFHTGVRQSRVKRGWFNRNSHLK